MHHIYQTEGVVLRGVDFGEANQRLVIFTKDFGLIAATAQSLRHLKSKLRYSLQEFSVTDLSLARGKTVWRITNASHKRNLYDLFSPDKNKLVIVANILNLTKKLLSGERRDKTLYEVIEEALLFLKKENFSGDEIKSFENIILIRILYNLGYFNAYKKINNRELYKTFLISRGWNKELLDEMKKIKSTAVRDINYSLNATHLF